MKTKCPICDKELTWVDNGPRLQYFFCKFCKEELSELMKKVPASKKSLVNNDYDDWEFPNAFDSDDWFFD